MGGSPPPAPTTTTTQTEFPKELQPYISDILGRGKAVYEQRAEDGYQPYLGPRIAEFDPAQLAAFRGIEGMVGGAEPYFTAAGQQLDLSSLGLGSAQQLTGTGADVTLGGLSNLLGASSIGQQAGMGISGAEALGRRGELGLLAGEQMLDPAAQLAAASAGDIRGDIGSYMSPYMRQVMDVQKREAIRQSDIAGQSDAARAAAAGAFGGSRQAILEAERERNLQQQLGDIEATGMQAAYADAARMAEAQRARELAASGQFGQLAGQAGQLGLGRGQLASTLGGLAGQRLGLAGLERDIASTYGTLGGQLANIGAVTGQLAGQRGTLAGQLAALGTGRQAQTAQELAALEGVGRTRQDQVQKALNIPYEQFLEEKAFPMQALQDYSSLIRGYYVNPNITRTQMIPQPSYLQQALGAGATAAGLAGGFGAFRKEGGKVDPRGGLGSIVVKRSEGRSVGDPSNPFKSILGDDKYNSVVNSLREFSLDAKDVLSTIYSNIPRNVSEEERNEIFKVGVDEAQKNINRLKISEDSGKKSKTYLQNLLKRGSSALSDISESETVKGITSKLKTGLDSLISPPSKEKTMEAYSKIYPSTDSYKLPLLPGTESVVKGVNYFLPKKNQRELRDAPSFVDALKKSFAETTDTVKKDIAERVGNIEPGSSEFSKDLSNLAISLGIMPEEMKNSPLTEMNEAISRTQERVKTPIDSSPSKTKTVAKQNKPTVDRQSKPVDSESRLNVIEARELDDKLEGEEAIINQATALKESVNAIDAEFTPTTSSGFKNKFADKIISDLEKYKDKRTGVLKDRIKGLDSDRWMVLANFGMNLMAQPGGQSLIQALGKAGKDADVIGSLSKLNDKQLEYVDKLDKLDVETTAKLYDISKDQASQIRQDALLDIKRDELLIKARNAKTAALKAFFTGQAKKLENARKAAESGLKLSGATATGLNKEEAKEARSFVSDNEDRIIQSLGKKAPEGTFGPINLGKKLPKDFKIKFRENFRRIRATGVSDPFEQALQTTIKQY